MSIFNIKEREDLSQWNFLKWSITGKSDILLLSKGDISLEEYRKREVRAMNLWKIEQEKIYELTKPKL